MYMPGSLSTWHVRVSACTSSASVVVVHVRYWGIKHIYILFPKHFGSKYLFAHICIYIYIYTLRNLSP